MQLWTISNYDWTLKAEIQKSSLIAAKWDNENPKALHLLTSNGAYDYIEIKTGYDSYDAIILSIAGDSARITDLSKAPIPPPMFHDKLSLGNCGVQIFSQSKYGIAFLLSDQTLVTCKLYKGMFL